MNWEAIGAIGETLGALGVILSLAYLALQIRHSSEQTRLNTKSVQATAYQQLIDHHSNLNLELASQPELFEILVRAEREGFESLTDMERNRWEVFIACQLRSFLNGFYLHRGGLITDQQWKNFVFGLEMIASRPAFAAWWRREKGRRGFPDEFAAIVEGASASPAKAERAAG